MMMIMKFTVDMYTKILNTICSQRKTVSKSVLIATEKKLRGLIRQRTIPTERPPLVGEVSAHCRG
jgi:hypothetical protein